MTVGKETWPLVFPPHPSTIPFFRGGGTKMRPEPAHTRRRVTVTQPTHEGHSSCAARLGLFSRVPAAAKICHRPPTTAQHHSIIPDQVPRGSVAAARASSSLCPRPLRRPPPRLPPSSRRPPSEPSPPADPSPNSQTLPAQKKKSADVKIC